MGKVMEGVALITGARSPAALDIARDLAAHGMDVHMADSVPAHISRLSRAPARVHRLRPAVQDASGFREDVADIVRRISPAIVIPTCEEVFHLASARSDGVDVGPLFAPDPETLDILHAKDRFNALASTLGLAAPPTVIHTERIDTTSMDLPNTVLKACYSRFGTGTLVGPTVELATSARPTPERPWVSQRRIRGAEHSSYAIAVDGRITGFAAYLSTQRLSGGAGYAFRPADDHVAARMLDASRSIAAALCLTGQMSLDAIDDGRHAWLIECNPRATSGVHLLSGGGAIARAMAGSATTLGAKEGARHNLPMMMSHGLARMARREARDAFGSGRDVIGAPDDRLPLLGAILDTIRYAVQAKRHGTTLTGATTLDLEWNGTR